MAVYLLHFDTPYKHARHYVGFTTNLERRLKQHATGDTSKHRLMKVVQAAGITWRLARVWWAEGDRAKERSLKRSGGASRYCPICKGRTERLHPMRPVQPKCDGQWECPNPVTHIDTASFVYCREHGAAITQIRRSRELTRAELHTLQQGGTVRYRRPRAKRKGGNKRV